MRQTRDVGGFRRVAFRGFGELFVTQGERDSLEIDASEEALGKISTEVRGGTLFIEVERAWSWLFAPPHRVRMYLTVRDLTVLDVSGAGRLVAERIETDRLKLALGGAGSIAIGSLQADELEVELDGAGTIRLAGAARIQDVNVPGAGSYDGKEVRTEVATVRLSGVGQVSLWVTETLDAQLSGIGSLEYYGDPTVKQSRTGLGAIVHRGPR